MPGHTKASASAPALEESKASAERSGFSVSRHTDQPLLNRKPGQARNAVDIQLAHDALAMRLYGPHPHSQAAGDFLVTQPFGDRHQHLALTIADLHRLRPFASAAHKLV